MSEQKYSVSELADAVNDWCARHQVEPLDNATGPRVTVRSVRYYQTLGLVERALSADGRGFREKHRLQLTAIRLLQAKGWPLIKIQVVLAGRTMKELIELEQRGIGETNFAPLPSRSPSQDWKVSPIDERTLILACSGREVTAAQRLRIQEILRAEPAEERENFEPEGFRPETD